MTTPQILLESGCPVDRVGQYLKYVNYSRAHLLKWIDFDPSLDK